MSEPERDARELAEQLVRELVFSLRRQRHRWRIERHELPDGRPLPSFEIRSRRFGTRVVVHVEPGL